MNSDLKKLVIQEFGGKGAQLRFVEDVKNGLWISEKYFLKKYFMEKNARILDIGCGAGRTTIPLSKMGFKIIGIDIVPAMINNAKKIAKNKKLKIDYRVGDATDLEFKADSFDYVLFSNQGWAQIPGKENRAKALKEAYRVLKNDGVYIFTTHPRVWLSKYFFFFIRQWIKFYILKPLGLNVEELDYGDMFFDREANDTQKTYMTKQYMHIPSVKEVEQEIMKAGFQILEVNGKYQISKKDVRPHPPVFFVCQK